MKKKRKKKACKNLSCAKWVGSGFTYISEGYLFGGKKKKKKKWWDQHVDRNEEDILVFH